jgi:hypothetical protein
VSFEKNLHLIRGVVWCVLKSVGTCVCVRDARQQIICLFLVSGSERQVVKTRGAKEDAFDFPICCNQHPFI